MYNSKILAGSSVIISTIYALSFASTPVKAQGIRCGHPIPLLEHFYVGAFGGIGHSSNIHNTQDGIAFFGPEAGGPLDVHASGHSGADAGILGLQVGYRWCGWSTCIANGTWNFAPAVEVEGFYLHSTLSGHLNNPTARLPEHTFVNSYPMRNGVYLVNGVVSAQNFCVHNVYPYLGIGVGGASISIDSADSDQVNFFEPGVNHFNSGTHHSTCAFAAQGKIGLNFAISDHCSLFAEYRLLYIASTNHHFGSTVYPNHVPTTRWNVNFDRLFYNIGVFGLKFDF